MNAPGANRPRRARVPLVTKPRPRKNTRKLVIAPQMTANDAEVVYRQTLHDAITNEQGIYIPPVSLQILHYHWQNVPDLPY